MDATVAVNDEAPVRALYQQMLDAWGNAAAYADCFTPDADYIIANGMLEKGRQEIVAGHEIIFSAWARNSHLVGKIDSIRFLTPGVAFVIAYGNVAYNDNRSSDDNKRTVYSLVAQKLDGVWRFAAYQNTPIEKR
ncbi:MAG TPA: SgcJ/EcaC family oxidoreductase [Candidatus Saccharimonadales bacterium]|nr:SgcJ/EcaC family oxidoreductase [Candidatus Saccharimonadales bacterium]